MVKSCCAYNCKQRYVKGSNITFHSFPKNDEIKSLWLQKLRRKDFTPTQNSVLCSKHFEEGCFDKNRFGGTWLKPLAIPTIFDYTIKRPHIKKPHPKKQLLPENYELKDELFDEDYENTHPVIAQVKEDTSDTINTSPLHSVIEPELTITVVNRQSIESPMNTNFQNEVAPLPILINGHEQISLENYTKEDMNSPELAWRALTLAKNKISTQKQKIQRITTKLKKSEQRIAFLTSIIQELQKNKTGLSDENRNDQSSWSPHFLDPSVSIKKINDC